MARPTEKRDHWMVVACAVMVTGALLHVGRLRKKGVEAKELRAKEERIKKAKSRRTSKTKRNSGEWTSNRQYAPGSKGLSTVLKKDHRSTESLCYSQTSSSSSPGGRRQRPALIAQENRPLGSSNAQSPISYVKLPSMQGNGSSTESLDNFGTVPLQGHLSLGVRLSEQLQFPGADEDAAAWPPGPAAGEGEEADQAAGPGGGGGPRGGGGGERARARTVSVSALSPKAQLRAMLPPRAPAEQQRRRTGSRGAFPLDGGGLACPPPLRQQQGAHKVHRRELRLARASGASPASSLSDGGGNGSGGEDDDGAAAGAAWYEGPGGSGKVGSSTKASPGSSSAVSRPAGGGRSHAEEKKKVKKKGSRSNLGALINRGKHGKRIPKMGTPHGGRFLMQRKLILVMVGLPARGKSYIVKMLTRYLRWNGFPCECFNIGNVRRKLGYASVDANFFKGNNAQMLALREQMAEMVQDEMYEWLNKDDTAKVALFDATNTTKARREMLLKRNAGVPSVGILFIESICDDPVILERNYRMKLENDDYKAMDPEVALKDFMERVRAYEKVYETIEDAEHGGHIKYIKIHNVGRKIVTRNVVGYLPSQVAFFLQNIHVSPRKLYLTLHAETVDDSPACSVLTEGGREYALLLAKYLRAEQETALQPPGDEIMVLTGTQEIHTETIGHLTVLYPCAATALLNSMEGLDAQLAVAREEAHRGPGGAGGGARAAGAPPNRERKVSEAFDPEDPQDEEGAGTPPEGYGGGASTSYPGVTDEAYADVIQRVRPLIVELERQTRSLVIVSNLSVVRCLYAYYVGVPLDQLHTIHLEPHTVIELTPGPFTTQVCQRTMTDMHLVCS